MNNMVPMKNCPVGCKVTEIGSPGTGITETLLTRVGFIVKKRSRIFWQKYVQTNPIGREFNP